MKKRVNISSSIVLVLAFVTCSIFISCDKNDDQVTNEQTVEETVEDTGGDTGGDTDGDSSGKMLEEKKGVRLHEHHTNDPVAIGGKSGYDLINHEYVRIFSDDGNEAPMQDQVRIDMHEAFDTNTASTESSNFGFTSEQESGAIPYGGNNTTVFMVAPSNFDYDATTTIEQIKNVFNMSTAVKTIKPVTIGGVYLAKLRNQEYYVAIKITAGVLGGRNAIDEVYFDFDYKYGDTSSTN